MSEQRSPARPWFDVVTEQSAIRGLGIAELARRAHVGRATIYGWRDGADGKIQAGPVNAVADVLGIPRERALRLAGIIGTAPSSAAPPIVPKSLIRDVMDNPELSDSERIAVLDAIEIRLAKERGVPGTAASVPAPSAEPERRRPAS